MLPKKNVPSRREKERGSYLDLSLASVFTMMEVDAEMSSSITTERGYQ